MLIGHERMPTSRINEFSVTNLRLDDVHERVRLLSGRRDLRAAIAGERRQRIAVARRLQQARRFVEEVDPEGMFARGLVAVRAPTAFVDILAVNMTWLGSPLFSKGRRAVSRTCYYGWQIVGRSHLLTV
jgi:hypothetical protein